jgi:protein phosphatase
MAKKYQVPCVAMVLDMPLELCIARDAKRPDRVVGADVVKRQWTLLHEHLGGLSEEGFSNVHVLTSEEQAASLHIARLPLACDKRDMHGPFDIIGDIHGCLDELKALLEKLGYGVTSAGERHGVPRFAVTAPAGRIAVFVGDLVDRGPDNLAALALAMDMTKAGSALCVPGNHEAKLLRHLQGKQVRQKFGLERTVAELSLVDEALHAEALAGVEGLTAHFVLDGGKLVIAHAGLKAHLQGRQSGKTWRFALYGETTGETDEFGYPVRYDWAVNYQGEAMVVYGHTPVLEAEWVNRTICIDTGCVFGGKLTALRYPEMELVEVSARREYYPRAKPLEPR